MKVYSALAAMLLASTAAVAGAPQQTQDSGAPVGDNQNSKTAGEWGGVQLEDFHLVEKLSHFDRERIPERVVHARGTGAEGEFVANGELSKYSKAEVFKSGMKTPTFTRFSTVIHPKGSPEALRDPRGFATKFYTTQGNWDLVGNDLPIFFIRDAIKFPDMIHSLKPSPVTNQQDPNRVFDFFSHVPESTNMLTHVYSDLGTPASYREMDGFGVHAFKLVDAKGNVVYAKFHWKSEQGVKSLSADEAAHKDFNYATKDLYDTIRSGNLPKWDLYVKILRTEDIAKLDYNAFDDTKDWLDMPETLVGTLTLTKVPDNFFESTEQVAFDPGVMVPGIEASPDRMLQGRIFSYSDTQRYRLGANYQMLPINAPKVAVHNDSQDGSLDFGHRSGEVNYQPTEHTDDKGAYTDNAAYRYTPYEVSGVVQQKAISKKEPFVQAGVFYKELSDEEKSHLVSNLSGDLNQVKDEKVKETMISHFYAADSDFGTKLVKATNADLTNVQQMAKDAVSE